MWRAAHFFGGFWFCQAPLEFMLQHVLQCEVPKRRKHAEAYTPTVGGGVNGGDGESAAFQGCRQTGAALECPG